MSDVASFAGRHLRRVGLALAGLAVLGLVLVRFAAPRGPPLDALPASVLLASLAMLLTLLAAIGLALAVAGLAFGAGEPHGGRAGGRAARADEE